MTQQSKRTQRAFTGLVGAPYDPEDRPAEPAPEPVAAPTKRGRPPKADAKTPAERKAKQRAGERAQAEAPERQKLWRRIEKRIRNSETAAMSRKTVCNAEGCNDSRHKHVEDIFQNLPAMRAEFMSSPLEKAQAIAELYGISDLTGRSSREGKTGTNDGAKLERMRAKGEWAERYGGGKRSRGASPDDHNENTGNRPDSFADTGNHGKVFNPISNAAMWDLAQRARGFTEATDQIFEGEEAAPRAEYEPEGLPPQLTLRCTICKTTVESWGAALAHIEAEYAAGQKQEAFCESLREAYATGTVPESFVLDAEKKVNQHVKYIRWVLYFEGLL